MNKQVPCWICKGNGIAEKGEWIDVGEGYYQQVSPDIECGLCDGNGMIQIGSKEHLEYKKYAI